MSLARASIVVAVICLAVPSIASAKTFEPTRKDDPSPNGCKPNNCSLREAVRPPTTGTAATRSSSTKALMSSSCRWLPAADSSSSSATRSRFAGRVQGRGSM